MPSTPTFPLRYMPLDPTQSVHVYLNGVEQYEGTDWTYDAGSNVVNVLAAMDAQPGDLIEARYAHNGARLVDA